MANLSGHQRKRWQVTIKLPSRSEDKNHRSIELDQYEYTYTTLGHAAGVAINRALMSLRKEPSLKYIVLRDCFVAVKYLGVYTKAMEAAEFAEAPSPAEMEPDPLANLPKWRCPRCNSDLGLTVKGTCAACGLAVLGGSK